jgi:hypothetical protein
MDRILALRALVVFSFALACGCTVQMGLANAPRLGETTLADSRVHDAIANGPDSCGRKLDPSLATTHPLAASNAAWGYGATALAIQCPGMAGLR